MQQTLNKRKRLHCQVEVACNVKELGRKNKVFTVYPSVDILETIIIALHFVCALITDTPTMLNTLIRLCGRRKVCGLGMKLVQGHVVHYFVMIRYLVVALVC